VVAIGVTLAPLACMHGSAGQERNGTTAGATGATGQEEAGAAATGSAGTTGRETEARASPSAAPSGAGAPDRRDEPGMLPDAAESDPAGRGGQATKTVIGTVEEADGSSLTLRSSKLSDPCRVTIGGDTRLVQEGESISREEITEGDQVRATFVGEGNAGTATEIAVIRKGGGKAVSGTERDVAGEQDREQAAPQQPSRSQ
jgi:hypothetical protein